MSEASLNFVLAAMPPHAQELRLLGSRPYMLIEADEREGDLDLTATTGGLLADNIEDAIEVLELVLACLRSNQQDSDLVMFVDNDE